MPETALADFGGQLLFGDAVVAHERPEIVTGGFGLRGHGVEHEAVTPCDRSPSGAPVPAGRCARSSMLTVAGPPWNWMICQRSTGPGLLQLRGTRPAARLDAAHPARDRDCLVAVGNVERRLGEWSLPDAGAVHEGSWVRSIRLSTRGDSRISHEWSCRRRPGRVVVPCSPAPA